VKGFPAFPIMLSVTGPRKPKIWNIHFPKFGDRFASSGPATGTGYGSFPQHNDGCSAVFFMIRWRSAENRNVFGIRSKRAPFQQHRRVMKRSCHIPGLHVPKNQLRTTGMFQVLRETSHDPGNVSRMCITNSNSGPCATP